MLLGVINKYEKTQWRLKMDMRKREIIYELAKGVQGRIKAQSYGHMRKKLISKQGISEIALYSAVADHLEENDIHPSKYIDDMQSLLELISENMFIIKTDNRFTYLRNRFASINMENSPESKGQFLCSRCFTTKQDKERAPHANYKHSCATCYKSLAKENSQRYQERKKKEKVEEIAKPTVEPVEPVELSTPAFSTQEEAPTMSTQQAMIPTDTNPFIEIESLTGDSSETIVSLSCKTLDLSKLLLHIDSFLIIPDDQEKEVVTEKKQEAIEEAIEE